MDSESVQLRSKDLASEFFSVFIGGICRFYSEGQLRIESAVNKMLSYKLNASRLSFDV